MIPGFEAIVEERIKKAQKEGSFDRLPGKGKPLTFEESSVPNELRMAHKILKNAGFLPPEVELKKEISKTQDLLNAIEDDQDPEKSAVQKRLNYLLSKLDTMRGTMGCPAITRNQYRNHLVKKLS